MNRSIVLDKHEMVIDKDIWESLLIEKARFIRDKNKLIEFIRWYIQCEFDYKTFCICAKTLLKKIKESKI